MNQRDVAKQQILAYLVEAAAWHMMDDLYTKLGQPKAAMDCLYKKEQIGETIRTIAAHHSISLKEI